MASSLGLLLPGNEIGIPLSAIALGLMVAIRVRPPLWTAALLVGFFAIFHGQAHATDLAPGGTGFLHTLDYGIGQFIAAGLLQLAGIAIGLSQCWKAGEVAVRVGAVGATLAGGILLWGGMR